MTTKGNTSSYQRILKGTALFGGVQVFQILVSLIKGKMTAILIGPDGLGITSLYTSSLAMIITLASMGCNLSCVRYLSTYDKFDTNYYYKVAGTQKIFLLLSMFGLVVTLVLSVILSNVSFGDKDHVLEYIVLSIYVANMIYSTGISSILQGMQELKCTAIGGIIPSIISLFYIVPIYYCWGVNGIVPVLLLSSIVSSLYMTFILNGIYKQHGLDTLGVLHIDMWTMMKEFISFGIALVVAVLIGNARAYAFNALIKYWGSLKDLGLYQAGTSITNQYVGMIFRALEADYLPRLSSDIDDEVIMNKTVNEQGEIVLLLALPLLVLIMVTAPLLIIILLSNEFVEITSFIGVMAFATIFQFIYFPISYIPYAKGDKKVFLLTDGILSNIFQLCVPLVFYKFYGLIGLAIGQIVNNVVFSIIVYFIAKRRYGYKMSNSYKKEAFIAAFVALLFLWMTSMPGEIYIIFSAFGAILLFYSSFVELDKRTGIKDGLASKFKKF